MKIDKIRWVGQVQFNGWVKICVWGRNQHTEKANTKEDILANHDVLTDYIKMKIKNAISADML